MNNAHTIQVTMFDDMVETVEFRCGDTVINTLVGDGNIQVDDCPCCGRDFTTSGAGEDKVIMSSSVPLQAPESPVRT